MSCDFQTILKCFLMLSICERAKNTSSLVDQNKKERLYLTYCAFWEHKLTTEVALCQPSIAINVTTFRAVRFCFFVNYISESPADFRANRAYHKTIPYYLSRLVETYPLVTTICTFFSNIQFALTFLIKFPHLYYYIFESSYHILYIKFWPFYKKSAR